MRLWLVALALAALARPHLALSQASDTEALLALRNASTNWPQYSAAESIDGWSLDTPVCMWTGVTCSEDGRVGGLILQCDGCTVQLVASLPPELANLTELTTLNLQGNLLFGSIPPEWGGPAALPSLQNL